jgi:hypothetical protein
MIGSGHSKSSTSGSRSRPSAELSSSSEVTSEAVPPFMAMRVSLCDVWLALRISFEAERGRDATSAGLGVTRVGEGSARSAEALITDCTVGFVIAGGVPGLNVMLIESGFWRWFCQVSRRNLRSIFASPEIRADIPSLTSISQRMTSSEAV